MPLSKQQYQTIMDRYDRTRTARRLEQDRRIREVRARIPEISRIDEEIAHISVESATRSILLAAERDGDGAAVRARLRELSGMKRQLLLSHEFPADYLDLTYSCSDCRDTGYIGSQRCHCFRRQVRHLLFEQSNLKEAVGRDTFDRFRLDYYSNEAGDGCPCSPRENMRTVLKEVRRFIDTFDTAPGASLLISGNTGVGKTFLTNCIAAELLSREKSVIYLSAHEFFEKLADYTFRREEENADTLSVLLHADLLIIDDLGTELNNGFINSQLFLCINERILHKKSTIINTNLSLKQLNETYSERISSRIIEFYQHFHIYGEDIRIKKAFSSLDGSGT